MTRAATSPLLTVVLTAALALTGCAAGGGDPSATGADGAAPPSSAPPSATPTPEEAAELVGGGTEVFPGRRMVALYGRPGNPALGVLGEQDAEASVVRAKELAAQYEPFSEEPVVPAFEIIASTASAAPGPDGDYSEETPVEELRPFVETAAANGVYVVLDLQPGRQDFLGQARQYEELLRMPNVGLALDPE
ncbi:hypothetical protein LQU92_08090 [Kocuria sp. LUK]|uniref:hypothetical protein n=1 Tax=Kocuria sp. LUK TaxID=2897828 RepID=UPI001E35C4AF|nr:hypothetical protein [Kocuria sp. LUK]MCD1145196.1 hypothetical protein [Kocuria sp. LUK]